LKLHFELGNLSRLAGHGNQVICHTLGQTEFGQDIIEEAGMPALEIDAVVFYLLKNFDELGFGLLIPGGRLQCAGVNAITQGCCIGSGHCIRRTKNCGNGHAKTPSLQEWLKNFNIFLDFK
jgi:hypothetical protein